MTLLPHNLTMVNWRYFGYHFCIKKDKAVIDLILVPKTYRGSDSNYKSTITRNQDFKGKTVSAEALKSISPQALFHSKSSYIQKGQHSV